MATNELAGSHNERPPLGELFAELARETATLVRHEVELAKVEMTSKAKRATSNLAQVAVGGVVALLGAMALVAATILIVAMAIPLWASAFIVGLVVSIVGAGLVIKGTKAFKQIDPAPHATIRSLQENKQWLREQVSR